MVKSMVLRELHTLEETTMDKVRFLMSDTGAQITEACREALEQKGVEVTVVEKDGNKVLQMLTISITSMYRPERRIRMMDWQLSMNCRTSVIALLGMQMSRDQIYKMNSLYVKLFGRSVTWKKGHGRLRWLMAHPSAA